MAYVKRPIPIDEDGEQVDSDVRDFEIFDIGADLYIRDRASPSAEERNITANETMDLGDIRDLSASIDGDKILFSMRAPFDENLDDDEQVTWNIWEYQISNDTLRRIIASDIIAEEGQDRMAQYLPDGRIVFSSTRQRRSRAILLDESKPQFSALDENRNDETPVLHVMNDDGSDIQQITFNQSHELYPSVLSTGEIVFSRWDNTAGNNAMHIYKTRPDGRDLQLLYGAESHDTGSAGNTIQFTQPRLMPDGNILALLTPFTPTDFGGELAFINVADYVENAQAVISNLGGTGPAQSAATVNVVRSDDQVSLGGRYQSAYPLFDGTDRLIFSWSQCRLIDLIDPAGDPEDPLNQIIIPCTDDALADPENTPAPALYGIWIYDPGNQTQLPIVVPEEGFMVTDIAVAETRPQLPVIFDGEPGVDLDADLVSQSVGLLHIRSVYDIDGVDTAAPNIATLADPELTLAADRPARFLRLEKAVSIPDDEIYDFDNSAFGISAQQGMREVLGYAPIEPDGSVKVKVPANVAFAVSVLDQYGRRIRPRHQNWLQVRPGDTLECNGCHLNNSGTSHGRRDAYDAAYDGALVTGVPFPNTDPALFADFGETMAEVRERITCISDTCSSLDPSVDIVYEDVWTDEIAAGRAKDDPFDYRYADLETLAPVPNNCLLDWNAQCRAVLNYEENIHPLWSVDRQVFDDMMVLITDNTCTSCHSNVDDMDMPIQPMAQLDLTDGTSDVNADHFKSYHELLSADNFQDVIDGTLQDVQIEVGIDPVTLLPILETIPVAPPMTLAGSINSDAFFEIFLPGGSHEGRLSGAEIKMLAEWNDIGAQYYNNPFDAPEN
ncbi:MAG: hypothetical protein HKM24_05150 [Gammaproteobacteria bacterium]|nr:hypothetical protein [Gammaproteobacteria bacterium]